MVASRFSTSDCEVDSASCRPGGAGFKLLAAIWQAASTTSGKSRLARRSERDTRHRRHLCLPARGFCVRPQRACAENKALVRWYHPCLVAGVAQTPKRPNGFAHTEPIVLWRMRRANGLSSHAVIGPRLDGAMVV